MPTCRLIVFESSTRWATALRTALVRRAPRIVEARSLAAVEAALVESPLSLVALETTMARLEAVLQFLQTVMTRFPRARTAVLLDADAHSFSLLLREAGAIEVLSSTLEIDRLARLARRHLALAPGEEELALSEFIREQMPWPAHATVSD